MHNLAIWSQVEKTKKSMTKPVGNGGYKFTAIDAHSQIQKATEVFGPCGLGWGVKNQRFDTLTVDPADPHYNLLLYTAELWWKAAVDGVVQEGSFEIAADIELWEYSQKHGWKPTKDPSKKVRTDALTKGLSWLGFNADVFLGKFDDSKYVAQLEAEERAEQQAQRQPARPAKPAAGRSAEDPQLTAVKKRINDRRLALGWELANLDEFTRITVGRAANVLDIPSAEVVLGEMMKLEVVA